jgi:hypothetical protein
MGYVKVKAMDWSYELELQVKALTLSCKLKLWAIAKATTKSCEL